MENKNKYLIITFILAALVIIAGTFAWLTYQSNKTALVLTVGDIRSLQLTLSPYQINGTLDPVTAYTSGVSTSVTAVNNSTTETRKFNLFYEIEEIDATLNTGDLKYTIVRNDNQTYNGDFTGSSNNSVKSILTQDVPANTTYTYTVYLWVDGYTNVNADSGSFVGELNANVSTTYNITVDLPEGLIPVTIANNGAVTAVSKTNPTWYDYDNKIWANAVLLSSDVRNTYQAISNGSASSALAISDTSKILAYFVYIPRYSYKVWQYTGVSATGQEREIEINFINKNVKEMATGNGQWYTHPAFNFGETPLAGIWVGKFETSVDTSSTCYTTPSNQTTSCNSIQSEPRILPGVDSLRYQTIGNQYQTAMVFSGGTMNPSTYITTYAGNNTFGLTSSIDSHMMKNSEWGAVAYLSHSKYGINTEIRKNNYKESSSPYRISTGCGANSANANTTTTVTTCAIPYGTVSGETYTYPQSTTGNISGIFDMSGGTYDRVMGHYGTNGDNFGFAAAWFTTTANSKYFDLYDSSIFTGTLSTNITFCSLTTCGGHALNETKSWYSDNAYFVYSSSPWFVRGGSASSSSNAGAFGSSGNGGSADSTVSFRVVLVDVGN